MALTLAEEVRSCAERSALPWGEEGDIISLQSVHMLADRHAVAGYRVEAEALRQDIHPQRYLRNMQSVTIDGQIRMLESTVAQVGLGGLGGNLLEMFLRMGVGTIRAADGDSFEATNLNRQALSSPANLGQPKAHAAIDRASDINPSVHVDASNEFLTPESLPAFLEGCDLVVDALGGLEMRLALQRAAAEANIPLVTGALAGWTGYVGVVMPGQVGPADIMGQDNAAEEKLGCPAPAVTFIASLMAAEASRLISEGSSPLEKAMLVVDMQTLTFETVAIA